MFPIFAGNSASTGYNLTRSLRFRASASGYLSRTLTTPTNSGKWTFSAWIKRGAISSEQGIFGNGSSSTAGALEFLNTDTLRLAQGATQIFITTQVFRDPSAWYHILLAVDTSASGSNKLLLYVNGVQVTSFSTDNRSSFTSSTFNTAILHEIGYYFSTSYTLDGYLAEVNFIDGQALTPSSFGSTNALTGVWQPARYTGSYGTNGFYLPFTDNSALTTSSNVGLGKDFSGNGNYWTTNNISITAGVTYDSMTDVPTLTSATAANFAVLNPLSAPGLSAPTNGNLTLETTNADSGFCVGTISSSSAYYFEITIGSSTGKPLIGVVTPDRVNFYFYYTAYDGAVYANGASIGNVGVAATGDIFAFAVNGSGSNNFVLYKNGVSVISATLSALNVTPVIYDVSGASAILVNANFGQRPFAYTPPTGFVALNTYNLPTSTIVKGNTVMDATLYTGTLLSNSIVNAASFKPDLVWVKSRSAATDNKLTDSVRGVTKGLISNTTGAETTDTQGLTAFGSAGFTVGTDTNYNNLAATYVAWQWQAGQGSTSTNTSGSITSTVSVNASAGFSVVTYTGTGANATVGHGLGVAPQLVITKCRGAGTTSWAVWHINLTSATYYLLLDSTAAQAASSTVWNSTAPTSSVFSVGTSTASNFSTMVAYCWTPIAGFSAFGSYSGNNSTDGPMVYTGFQPKFVLIKGTGNASGWQLQDSARNTYNVVNAVLRPDLSAAESTGYGGVLDFLSNGFKLRTTDTNYNNSGYGPYIYMAFATNPFKQSLAF